MPENEYDDLSDEELLTWISETMRRLDVQYEAFNETQPPDDPVEHVRYLQGYIEQVDSLQNRLDALRQAQRSRGQPAKLETLAVANLLQSSYFHLDVISTVLRDDIGRTQTDLQKAEWLIRAAQAQALPTASQQSYQAEVIELNDKLDELIAALRWIELLRQALGYPTE